MPNPISESTLEQMVQIIHAQPDLNGCMIGFYGNNSSRLLHPGMAPSVNFLKVVIIEATEEGTIPARREPASTGTVINPGSSGAGTRPPAEHLNRSQVGAELLGTGLSCGMAVWAGFGVFGGAAAAPVSGGTSLAVSVIAWTGFVTAGLQCVNGIVRTTAIAVNPDGTNLHDWDENGIYSFVTTAVDAIGIASGLAGAPAAMRGLMRALETRGALSLASLERMTRAQRSTAIRNAVAQASRTPEGRREIEALARAALEESGRTASRARTITGAVMRGGGRINISDASAMASALRPQTASALREGLGSLLQTSLGIGISATPQSLTGSGSGAARKVLDVFIHVSARTN